MDSRIAYPNGFAAQDIASPGIINRIIFGSSMDYYLLADGDDGDEDKNPYSKLMGAVRPRERTIQIIASLLLGVTAFLTFCVLRPRWTGLYAARKKQKNEAAGLPELPDSLFGWIMPLWRITDQQVLASAGMDAYAFLQFFKMAMKFLLVTLFFSLLVVKPVHDANPEPDVPRRHKHHNDSSDGELFIQRPTTLSSDGFLARYPDGFDTDYLWMYLVFAYLFSALAVYLIISGTRRVIEVRQEYLGAQTSVTDRTIRLSGIPADLQDEEKIKVFIESLDIGHVESVTVCRNWKELDDAVAERMDILRRLEEAYTIYQGRRRVERNLESLPISQPQPPSPYGRTRTNEDEDEESAALLGANGNGAEVPYERSRPKTRIGYGFMGLRSKKVDAIDHYEEKLRQADENILRLRSRTFAPTPLAFVTMDSVAACQMAIQAVLDPSPLQLIANPSPAPADVIWTNTYLPRRSRVMRAWCVTSLIVLLTLFWSVVFVGVAGLLTLESIGKVFPELPGLLEDHRNIQALVNGQLPTLIASLLMVLVPYLYYWMSWYQGFISQGDVELSAISKNFFFTFFNFFVVFTISGTGLQFLNVFGQVQKALRRDVWKLAELLAQSLQRLLPFYVNFIILQGVGLFPFRLLEIGSVTLYPMSRIGAKTPRDYAELVQPPMFSYGFYLPTSLLIFIICMVYSVLRESWQVLLAGLVYFALGHFVYKYQLLYAMDNQQQATGRAWVMICDRMFVGLVFFQLATTGQLVLKKAVARGVLMLPLLIATIWMSIVYSRTYKPLMKFIALRSVKLGERYADHDRAPEVRQDPPSEGTNTSTTDLLAPERNAWAENATAPLRYYRETRTPLVPAVDDSAEPVKSFVNPSLVIPLEGVWIADKKLRRENAGELPDENEDEAV